MAYPLKIIILIFNLLITCTISQKSDISIWIGTDLSEIKNVSDTCPSFTCRKAAQSFTSDTCMYFISTTNSYYAQKCSDKSKICVPLVDQNSTCVNPTPIINNKWPGEKCQKKEDCSIFGPNCVNGTCAGFDLGESCVDDNNCNPGLRCQTILGAQTCQKQIDIGKTSCNDDYDCVNGAGCYITSDPDNNTCVSYYSLSPQHEVYQCINDQNKLCQSGTCALKNESEPNVWACTIPLKNPQKLPTLCTTSDQCYSNKDPNFSPAYSIVQPCTCGWNKDRSSFCPLFPGDPPYFQYTQQHLKWLQSSEINKCNTVRREAEECQNDYWDSKNVELHKYYQGIVLYYAQMQESEDCVIKIFLRDWKDAEKDLDESALFYAVSLVYLMAII
ncbi:unnamed protein product [Blepharisma stoltei]|uniref:Dickkopf N-terminal cysteine-rich domain-containing protein n=1 Tax=Blepharisma stoltei TaxID=1481888 RepID=A0AAU9KJD9_9CILI|nr:unnamed protein product [Blepharisma stoltei]